MSDTAPATITEHEAAEVATRQRDRAAARRLHPRPVAAAEQLGPLGRRLRGGRLHRADAGLARRSRDRRGGQRATPRCSRARRIGEVADHFEEVIRGLDRKPAVDRPLVRRPADPDPRRPRLLRRLRGDRPGAVPRRAPAADLGAEGGEPGARQPRQPQPRDPAHLRPVPLLRSPTRSARRRRRSSTRRSPSRRPASRCSRPPARTSTRGPRRRSTPRTPTAARC